MKNVNELVGKELRMYELDNEMESMGYGSENSAINNWDIIDSGCICYTKDGENYDTLDFDVVEEDVIACDTTVRVIGVR